MRFLIISREAAIAHTNMDGMEPYIMISISEDPTKPVPLVRNPNMIALLRLYFDDVMQSDPEGIPMSAKDAIDVKDFVDQWRNKVKTIIVHCTAGICRSAGIAAALSVALNNTDNWVWDSKRYIPNTHCYNMVLKAYGMSLEDYCKQKYAHLCDELRKDEGNENKD